MAVRIRMKRLGRRHRPFFRICAVDSRKPRDGRVIEELGFYDPMVKETNARAVLQGERIDYWLGVGAQPSDKVKVLIKKYGTNGTHLSQQQQALERLSIKPTAPEPVAIPAPKKTEPSQEAAPSEEAGTKDKDESKPAETAAQAEGESTPAADASDKPSE